MSRPWTERKYLDAENLWLWIDEQSHEISRRFDDEEYGKTGSYKAMLCGRKEMLSSLMDWLKDNETTLGEVAENWGLKGDE